LAAALWTRRGHTPAASAGTQPAARVHPRAITVGRRHGLNLNPTRTANVTDIVRDGDLVIAVCDQAHEDLTGPAGVNHPVRPRLHWSVPDPVPLDTNAAFEAAYADLAGRIDRVAPALAPGVDHA
jgi:protein-tyrosine-phosphatase